MSTTVGKLNLIKNTEDYEVKKLQKKADNLFKLGAGVSIFSTGVLCASTVLDLTRIAKVSSKFSLACGAGVLGGVALMLASLPIQIKAEKRALELQYEDFETNKLDEIS